MILEMNLSMKKMNLNKMMINKTFLKILKQKKLRKKKNKIVLKKTNNHNSNKNLKMINLLLKLIKIYFNMQWINLQKWNKK